LLPWFPSRGRPTVGNSAIGRFPRQKTHFSGFFPLGPILCFPNLLEAWPPNDFPPGKDGPPFPQSNQGPKFRGPLSAGLVFLGPGLSVKKKLGFGPRPVPGWDLPFVVSFFQPFGFGAPKRAPFSEPVLTGPGTAPLALSCVIGPFCLGRGAGNRFPNGPIKTPQRGKGSPPWAGSLPPNREKNPMRAPFSRQVRNLFPFPQPPWAPVKTGIPKGPSFRGPPELFSINNSWAKSPEPMNSSRLAQRNEKRAPGRWGPTHLFRFWQTPKNI